MFDKWRKKKKKENATDWNINSGTPFDHNIHFSHTNSELTGVYYTSDTSTDSHCSGDDSGSSSYDSAGSSDSSCDSSGSSGE